MISIVVPVFNNACTLDEMFERIRSTLGSSEFEVIFVDDGSRDDSLSVLSRLADKQASVKVISLSRNYGQHPAICAGFDLALGDQIVLMDADLQDPPESLPELLAALRDGVEIAYTIKIESSRESRVSSFLFHALFSKIVGADVPRNVGTYRAFTRPVLEALRKFPERNILYGPLMFFIGFRSVFVSVPHEQRREGGSSYTFWRRLQLASTTLISYTDLPHRVFIGAGISILSVASVYGLAVMVQYVLFGSPLPPGITLLILLMVILLGSIMLGMGIVGSYVFRVYQEVLRRPRYLVASRKNC